MTEIQLAMDKVKRMEWLEERSIISVDAEHGNACIHELMYNSLSNKGVVKLVNSMYLLYKIRRALKFAEKYEAPAVLTFFVKHDKPGKKVERLFRFDGEKFLTA